MESQEFAFDINTVQNLVAYQQAMTAYRQEVKRILQANEMALSAIAAEFYGDYTVFKITYAVLALEETEDDEEADFEEEVEVERSSYFGGTYKSRETKQYKGMVEKYEAYVLSDQPDKDGYYRCYEPRGSHVQTTRVKFNQIAKIEEVPVHLCEGNAWDNNMNCFPAIGIDNANVSRLGNTRTATIHYPPTADRQAIINRCKAVVLPLPEEPKHKDFGISDETYRAIRSLVN